MRISRAGNCPAAIWCLWLWQELFAQFDPGFPHDRVPVRPAKAAIIPNFIRNTFNTSIAVLMLSSYPILKARPQSRVRPSFRGNCCLYCEADLRLRLPRTTKFPVNANSGARVFAL